MTENRGTSLTRRVPLFLAALLTVVLASATVIGYVQLRRLLADQNQERLVATTQLLAQLLSTQLSTGAVDQADSLATLAVEGGGIAPGAVDVLSDAVGAREQARGIWLEIQDGPCLGVLAGEERTTVTSCPERRVETGQVVSPLFVVDGEVRYRAAATVDAEGTAATVTFEEAFTDAEGGALVANLVAPDAELLLGNGSGDVWTDLGAPVDRQVPLDGSTGRTRFTEDGEARVGAFVPIAGSPWVALIHRNEGIVLAPSRSFLWWMTGGGIVILLLGTLGSAAVSRRITRPLAEVTRGSEAIAGGAYHHRVEVERDDEVGRLANSFNRMAERVQQHHDTLETEVQRRTGELQEALHELTDAQEQLLRKERLATIGQLAGGVGHELRNPLGVMTNALFYLRAVMPEPPGKVGEYFGILEDQISTSEKIVTDLLDFARVKAPQREDVGVRDLFDEALSQTSVPDGFTVEVDVPDPSPTVRVDRKQVVQVIQNLTTNAVQAMESSGDGGTLSLSMAASDGRVSLRVTDSGPGIAADELERIFEPLVTSKARGIGLGLAVSRTLATQNGGSLTVESRVGEGSTFVLSLPRSSGGSP